MSKHHDLSSTRVAFLFRPGRTMSDAALAELVGHLRGVAAQCLDEMPEYQCLSGDREVLSRNVIAVAWHTDALGERHCAGFCSALLLDVPEVGEVLHLGLTCVAPAHRGARLTHQLTSTVLTRYLMRRPFDRVWATNVACVLSSLGNVALHFDAVHPSPFTPGAPSPTHLRIAKAVLDHHRADIHISPQATFDPVRFVLRGSNEVGNMFCKREEDTRYHHRERLLNRFYQGLMDFEAGDEVLQVGHVSLWSLTQYAARQMLLPGTRRRRLQSLVA